MKTLTTVVFLSGLFLGSSAQAAVETELVAVTNQAVAQQLDQFRAELKQQIAQSVHLSLSQLQLPEITQSVTEDVGLITAQTSLSKISIETAKLPE
jgi:hypothetical protein